MSNEIAARQKMVDCQVRPADVTDLRIIDAMWSVPREAFLPDENKSLAYLDLDVQAGTAGDDKVYLIKPATLARMLQAAEINTTDRVLVIGGASGYAAAIVSRFAADVTAAVPTEDFAQTTQGALTAAGSKARVVVADAGVGYPAGAPYDVIVLDGQTEVVPGALYSQLKVGGRLVGVFADTLPAHATLVTRSPGDFGGRSLFNVVAPVLPGLKRVPAFSF